jgi:hypothetical protein
LSRAVVQLSGYGIQASGTVYTQVVPTWEVLTEKAVGVLVAPALPWAMRVAEVHNHVRVRAEANVVGHLFALIPGQRPPQLGGRLGHLARQGRAHILGGSSVRQVKKHDIGAGPLHQSTDR